MAHPIICSICGERFDRDKIQAVRTGARRYAHASCDPNNTDLVPLIVKETKPKKEPTKEQQDMKALKAYINEIYGKTANWVLITKQIKEYQKEYQYSLSGILKTLMWFYGIKGNSPEKSNGGIGIVPFAYKDAFNYYYDLFVAQSLNENVNVKELTERVKEVTIPPPAVKIKKRFFNLDDNEEEVIE